MAEPRARVGIVGAGLMGLGIAQAVAASGGAAVLCSRDPAVARERFDGALRRQVARGRFGEADAAAIGNCVTTGAAERLAGCDLVIECVPEDRPIKLATLAAIERVAPTAIVASNTSGLSIVRLAQALREPSRFLGLHFFSPAERMKLVEVVRGPQTSAATVAAALAFTASLAKRPVVVRDGPGFFATGVFAAYLDEAVAMVIEGVAPETIDAAATAQGRALGPLAVLDETGIALNLAQARQARADGLPARYSRALAEPALALLVAAGRRGRRDGGGFYEGPSRAPWRGLAAAFPPASAPPDGESIRLRLFAAEAGEALRRLEESVVASADDADAASVLGLGYPAGGVLGAVEAFGLGPFVSLCDRLAAAHGERFAPSPWLRALAAQGQGLAAYRGTATCA